MTPETYIPITPATRIPFPCWFFKKENKPAWTYIKSEAYFFHGPYALGFTHYCTSATEPTGRPGMSEEQQCWKCPWCGCEDTWFDRTITIFNDGTEEGMQERCCNCGKATDDVPSHPAPKEGA